jgi:hypothetical protein
LPLATAMLGLLLTGCGRDVVYTYTYPTVPAVPFSSVIRGYHAYGDSIAYGYTLSNSSVQAFPHLISKDNEFSVSDFALPGDQACDIAPRQIGRNLDAPAAGDFPLYTVLIGTNDADVEGIGPYEATFDLCQQAAIAWLAMPDDLKVLAPSGTVNRGFGTVASMGGWKYWLTDTQDSSISFSIKLPATAPIYVWRRIVDGDSGTYTVAVDGTLAGSLTTASFPAMSTQNGTTASVALFRIPAVPAGQHTISFTQTSVVGTMQIVGIGVPPSAKRSLPPVIVGSVPLQMAGTNAPCSTNPLWCYAYTADVYANVMLFHDDGLDVRFADNHPYMHATAAEMNDPIHPNPLGQSELRTAFERQIPGH